MPSNAIKRNSYFYGIFAEILVVIFLTFKGYVVLKRRYKTHLGEIDIIAKRMNSIHFVEVKSRFNKENLDEVLTSHQVKRIKNASILYLSKKPNYTNCDISYDLIKVSGFFIHSHDKNYF